MATAAFLSVAQSRSAAARTRVRTIARRTAILLLALLAILILVEIGMRMYYRLPIVERYFASSANRSGYSLMKSIRYEYLHDGRRVLVTTDGDGHRIVPSAPATAMQELYVIGDSQVFGWGLTNSETLPERLQRELGSGWRVVNAGVPGYGPFAYSEELEKIPPSAMALVVQTEANDFQDAFVVRPPLAARCGYLLSRTPLGDHVPCFLLESLVFAKLAEFRVRAGAKLPVPLGYNPHTQVAARVLRYRIDSLYARSAPVGRTLYASIPWDASLSPRRLANYAPTLTHPQRLLELPDDCHLERVFQAYPDPDRLFREIDSHLSAQGARVAAARLAVTIRAFPGLIESRRRVTK
jgi:hypothetical protein